MTPLQQQYERIKKQFADTIVYFRRRGFYETFNDDAEIVCSIFHIVLTAREVETENRVPAGEPPENVD
jgi:DNA mismatch repair ATPase MutS